MVRTHAFDLTVRPLNKRRAVVTRPSFKFFVVHAEPVKQSLTFGCQHVLDDNAATPVAWLFVSNHRAYHYFSHNLLL